MMRMFLAFVLTCGAIALHATTNPPNVIVILADDMGYSDIGCYGSEIETSNIDSLAANGLRFRNFYNTGRCSPSRACLLTGRYQHQVGVGHLDENWNAPGYMGRINSESVTIAEVLRSQGYYTAMAGKWHLGSDRPNWPIDRGFDRMFSSPNGGGYYFRPFETANRPVYLNEDLVDLDQWETDHNGGQPFYSTEAFTTMALEFMEEAVATNKPFFVYLAFIAPHDPLQSYQTDVNKYLNSGVYSNGWDPVRVARFQNQTNTGGIAAGLVGTPNAWSLSPTDPGAANWAGLSAANKTAAEQRMAIYAGAVDRMDQQVGRVLDKLDTLNVASNTIVIFVSDNGAYSGGGASGDGTTGAPIYGNTSSGVSYGLSWANKGNTPFRRFKSSNQEGGIETPCVIRWPAGITQPGGTVLGTRGHLVDLLATILDATGTSYPSNYNGNAIKPIEGVSLKPLFTGGSVNRTNSLFFEHEGERAVITTNGWKLFSRNNAAWELYNLNVDPQELNDLAGVPSNATLVASLTTEWFDWADNGNVKDYPVTSLQRIVLSPTVAQAAVNGPVNGNMALTRTSSSGNVDVALAISGTASPGSDYTTLPTTISFTAGNTSTQLVVAPLPGGLTRESKSVQVTVKPRYGYIEPWNPETVWISPDTYDTWAATNLPSPTYNDFDRLPTADSDGDGVPNFVERARGTDPTVADPPHVEVLPPVLNGNPGNFTYRFLHDPGVLEVGWKLWLSDDLKIWRDGTAETLASAISNGPLDTVSLMWTQSVANVSKQFARLEWLWAGGVFGDPIALYAFNAGTNAATTVPIGGSASTYDPRTASFPAGNQSGISSANEHAFVRSSGTSNSLADTIAAGAYHQCSITFGAGNPASLTGLSFDHLASSSTGFTSSIAVFVSTNGFASPPSPGSALGISTQPVPAGQVATTSLGHFSTDLTPLGLANFVGTLSIRLYFFDDIDADNEINRLDNLTVYALSSIETLAEYNFDTGARTSSDTSSVIASNYVGGTIGVMPNESRTPSAGLVAYSTGADTGNGGTATHSFTVNFDGDSYSLSRLNFDYYVSNIAFAASTFSYQLTSSLTGGTVLASETFTSLVGGTADFGVSEFVDLSANPAFQGITGTVTFTFTFFDNSTGTGRSHGIDNVVLKGVKL